MILNNKKGDEFRLEIIGYQFPSILDSYWDSNWLNVEISVSNSMNSWSCVNPCLLTFEVNQLATWLDKLVVDKISTSDIGFVEPSPQFRFIKHASSNYFLRVDLGHIFRKKLPELFAGRQFLRLYFRVTDDDLIHQASLLRKQLTNYPQRVFR